MGRRAPSVQPRKRVVGTQWGGWLLCPHTCLATLAGGLSSRRASRRWLAIARALLGHLTQMATCARQQPLNFCCSVIYIDLADALFLLLPSRRAVFSRSARWNLESLAKIAREAPQPRNEVPPCAAGTFHPTTASQKVLRVRVS